jgi:hypothetical protein
MRVRVLIDVSRNNDAVDPAEFMETTSIHDVFKEKQDDTKVLTDTVSSWCMSAHTYSRGVARLLCACVLIICIHS